MDPEKLEIDKDKCVLANVVIANIIVLFFQKLIVLCLICYDFTSGIASYVDSRD